MALDEPSAQLSLDIRASVQAALASRRPILHHLNADTSWFLQIPRPDSAIRHGGRTYYNILIDPWLSGGQSDVASWFSQQFHATKSSVQSVAEVEELAREIEILSTGLRLGAGRKADTAVRGDSGALETFIDALVISHEFTDHCHKETCLEILADVPVFAIKEAAAVVRGWKHFRTVITVESFGVNGNTDWRNTSIYPLPEWLGISRLLQKEDVLNYHAAIMITFNNGHHDSARASSKTGANGHATGRREGQNPVKFDDEEDAAEAMVYTPHGIYSGDLNLIPDAEPPVRTLAFMHGLHNVRVGTASGRTALQSNLGAHNGLKAQRILNAKYWISTHDEVKKGGGLVARFLQRDVISLKDALDAERRRKRSGGLEALSSDADDEVLDAFEGTNWVELANGESKVLM